MGGGDSEEVVEVFLDPSSAVVPSIVRCDDSSTVILQKSFFFFVQ
jgi:hypothetical protein